ncbi:VWA-like domain-containing protein [Clostridium sp. AL.422]|uniref:vWA domain-containing protein n=1 Tax=Clostridium TaxID=1485 RepID=UPI00293DA2BA|nr:MULTISPECIES: VWA-like domain-containing protein [unclassified Clostridium]MDV4152496.1 VWA-like domain-containing protein [Clostridium sp. AL.422]
MRFEERRDSLLKQALDMKENGNVYIGFEREFFSLVENVIIDMLEGEDSFFGQFLVRIERNIRLNITWPLATVPKMQGFRMYFNPLLFLSCDKREMQALFKHEIYHIMYGHHERERILKQKYTNLAVNLAMDISINQFIKNLPMESYKIERVNKEYSANLKEDKPIEVYAEEIEKAIKTRLSESIKDEKNNDIGDMIDISKAHDVWEESTLNQDAIKDMTKKTAISSYNGNAPKDIVGIINSYTEKAEISWQDLLKRVIPSLRAGEKKTIMRRNRRQPERLDLRGSLPNNVPEVIVALDISASMSEEEFNKILIEVLEITRTRTNKITVIECDNEIRRIYEIKSKNDIKKRSAKNGSTKFSPVFKYIRDNKLRNSVLIYFTDGVGEKELEVKPFRPNTIWVITGDEDLSLEKPYGEIKRISTNVKKGEGGTAGLEMIKEYQQEHGRYF